MTGEAARALCDPLSANDRAYVADSMRYAVQYLLALAANLETMSRVTGSAAVERCAGHHARAAQEIARAAAEFAYLAEPP